MTRPQVICLTPVRNEAWILDRFLRCASMWADHIIVADQGSDDGSRDIARRFPKVRLIENGSNQFNEPERQKLLIDAARGIEGPRLLIALDADEFLTATFRTSREWELMLNAIPGTIFNFQMPNILPDKRTYYLYPTEFTLGFMDDGTEHSGPAIHSPRLPRPEHRPRVSMREIKVMHFATMEGQRFRSRIRWYQCWEFLKGRHVGSGRWGSLMELYRDYHRDFFVAPHLVRPLPDEWITGYPEDLLQVPTQDHYRWDEELLRLFLTHGPERFSKIAVWEVDWDSMYRHIHGTAAPVPLSDPRTRFERWVHRWLERTQPLYSHGAAQRRWTDRLSHRLLEKTLGLAGW